ncbi:hypothetical protein WBP06_12090 [Novosphingobium sp. BL-8H]|uniref:hypothetical protein n=1 Tax=Novosphingobium sp. BL-8H TaxID=3127640 RepID=UPI003757ED72
MSRGRDGRDERRIGFPKAAGLVPFLAGASLLARGDRAAPTASPVGEEAPPAPHHALAQRSVPRPRFAQLPLPGLTAEPAIAPPLRALPIRAALQASAAPVALAAAELRAEPSRWALPPAPATDAGATMAHSRLAMGEPAFIPGGTADRLPTAARDRSPAPIALVLPAVSEVPVLSAAAPQLDLPTPAPLIAAIPPATPPIAEQRPALLLAVTQHPAVDTAPPDPPQPALAASRALPAPSFGLAGPQTGKEMVPASTANLTPANATQTFPANVTPVITYDDEVILAVKVAAATGTAGGEDTVIAYGTRGGLYLPLGALARTLDLAISVGDEGHYASGWFLSENRRLTVNLREGTAEAGGKAVALAKGDAVAFDGELYVRAERIGDLLPLAITPNLRDQSITIRTLEPFPVEQRLAREAERERLGNEQASAANAERRFPRQDTPWLPISVPMVDVEARAVSDTTLGERVETDLRLAGDLAWMSAQVFLTHSTRDGLTAAHIELGRIDPDADLLGPLHATVFAMGDVATTSLPIGLRGVAGRGGTVTNAPVEAASVFDRIDLRGQLPDGYEVELYRNGVLVGSTRLAINGQYQFLQVPVDYGLNLFRLVFYGPQGQRSEEVRRISVGDGRLSKGQVVYTLGAVQKDENLLGVTAPRFIPGLDYGRWRASAQLAYGVTAGVTAVVSGGWFDSDFGDRWLASTGLRTGLGGLAAKLDFAMQDGATPLDGTGKTGRAIEAGLGGRLLGASFTLTHAEYRGDFLDEVRVFDGQPLRRVTELDANATLRPWGEGGLSIPLYARARRIEYASGEVQTTASLRGSARVAGVLASNTLEYSRYEPANVAGGGIVNQVIGTFDLSTLNGSRTQVRAAASYTLVPDPRLEAVSLEVDRSLDDRTLVRASAAQTFHRRDTQLGLSAERRFRRFTLAFDGTYGLRNKVHSVALRLGFGFGRDPLTDRVYVAPPGQALSGAVALRAYEDRNGDGQYDTGDKVLPEVAFGSGIGTGETDGQGVVLLTGLPAGTRVSVQVDPTSLPDIALAPVTRGIEVVPRPGRIHRADFAVVAMSEIEGTAYFEAAARSGGKARSRGVSGLQLRLIDAAGKVASSARTEADGFYLFEQVRPGRYTLAIDPDQAARLKIVLRDAVAVDVGPSGSTLSRDLFVVQQ